MQGIAAFVPSLRSGGQTIYRPVIISRENIRLHGFSCIFVIGYVSRLVCHFWFSATASVGAACSNTVSMSVSFSVLKSILPIEAIFLLHHSALY